MFLEKTMAEMMFFTKALFVMEATAMERKRINNQSHK